MPTADSGGTGQRRYRCFTKARQTDLTAGLKRGGGWVTARRGWFEVYDDRLTCGDWVVDLDDITDAVVHETSSLFITYNVLEVTLTDHAYQFGFNPWARVVRHLPFPFTTEQTQLGWSRFSVMIRVGLVVAAVAFLFSLREVPDTWP